MRKNYFRRDEIIGKDIISDIAARLGKVKDIGYNPEGKIVLIYDKSGEEVEEATPSSQIIALGDVVPVKSAQPQPAPTSTPPGRICLKCGKTNPPDFLYCTGCGSRLEGV